MLGPVVNITSMVLIYSNNSHAQSSPRYATTRSERRCEERLEEETGGPFCLENRVEKSCWREEATATRGFFQALGFFSRKRPLSTFLEHRIEASARVVYTRSRD